MIETPQQANTPKKPSLAKTFGIVALLTILSKFAGLARDIVMARAYGTGLVSDAYNYSYMLTGQILVLFGGLGGPFHVSTVAVVGHKKDDKDAGSLVGQVLAITVLLLAAISILVYFLGHLWLAPMMASQYSKGGYTSVELQQAYQASLLQQLDIMLPLIVIAGVIGVVYGVLNIFNKVAWPSISPAIASIAIIVAIFAFNDPHSGLPLALGTLVGAVGQLVVQLPSFFKTGFKYSIPFKPHPELKKYLSMLIPALVATEIGTLTSYVDAGFTNSIGAGAWTAYQMANKLIQLPLGVLITAMVVPVLPIFTQQAKDDRPDDLKQDLRRALRLLWFLGLPICAILLALPTEIIKALFQRGQWTDYSTWITSASLLLLVPSIFFYMARDLITRVFYAYHDSKSPSFVAILAIFVKAILDYLLVIVIAPQVAPQIYASFGGQLPVELQIPWSLEHSRQATALSVCGIAGISLATTLMTIFNLALLTYFARKKIGLLGFRKLFSPVAIMCVSSIICFAVTLGAYRVCERVLAGLPFSVIIGIAIASSTGFGCYLLACIAAKLDEPHTVAKRLPFIKRFVT